MGIQWKQVDHKLKPDLVVVGRVLPYEPLNFSSGIYSIKWNLEGLTLWSTSLNLMINHV